MNWSAISINTAARDHGVYLTTLKNRLSGSLRVVDDTNLGPVPYLNEEEKYLIQTNKKDLGQVKVIAQTVAANEGGTLISDGVWRWFLQQHP